MSDLNLPEVITNEFFKQPDAAALPALITAYNDQVAQCKTVAEFMLSNSSTIGIFMDAAGLEANNHRAGYGNKVFDIEAAKKVLDASYWQRAIMLTDLLENMPQKRRSEWTNNISERTCPAFEQNTVFETIKTLLQSRPTYLAERVDGFFKALSGEHVTNSPYAFGKRMILPRGIDSFGSLHYETAGYLDDMRKVIAKLHGVPDELHPEAGSSSKMIRHQIFNPGEWFDWDAGRLRVRIYKKGTIHLEVHPQIAYKLNQILSILYPSQLAHASTRKPTKIHKDFNIVDNPIAPKILDALADGRFGGLDTFYPAHAFSDAVGEIMKAIGGVPSSEERRSSFSRTTITVSFYKFDYPVADVILKIMLTGVIPDKKSHQFYPTPKNLSEMVIEMGEIETNHTVLEPSAGHGDLLLNCPSNNVTCFELSELHCDILTQKGFTVNQGDFLTMKPSTLFDRIVMNPPFSEGRAKAHLEHAVTFLAPGGRLVAILPSGMKDKPVTGAKSVMYSEVMHKQFVDAAVSVVICTITK
jgi:hypothetical protein